MKNPIYGRFWAPAVPLLLLLTGGCGSEDFAGGWEGTVETLPNGTVRIVNPAEGLWRGEDRWALVPELVLGQVEEPESEVFGAVSGLEADEDGRIYVLDRQANELRIFSGEGTHIRSGGRSGSGPGEYANANGLAWMSPDSLLVVDQRGNRYSILTREGEFVRSVPRQLGFYGWVVRGGLVDRHFYEFSFVRVGEGRLPALIGTSLEGSGANPGDTLMLPITDAPPFESFSVQTERGGMSMGVPFTPGSVYHLDHSGGLWHGHGSDFRVFRSTLLGDTISEIVIEGNPAPVTTEELAAWEAGPSVQSFREMGGDLDMTRIPGVKPFFDDLYLDPDGYLWVSVPAGPTEAVFALIDPEGRYLGRLQTEGFARDVFLPPVVLNGRLYLVGRDELDVQRVYVFRIER
jgi:hypothetical protein